MKRLSIIIFVIVTLLVFIIELTGNSRVQTPKNQFEVTTDTVKAVAFEENLNTTRRALKLALK